MHGQEVLDIHVWMSETSWDDERRYQYLKKTLLGRKLLDFGCGAGGFLLRSRSITSLSHGVEPEKRLCDHFQANGLKIFSNLKETSKAVLDGYDIITIFHVLEHISDPKAILVELSKLLTDGGQILVEVPNADDALLTLYENVPFSHFTYWSCHLYLYTMKTLQMLFDQVNLKVNYIKQIQRYPLSNHLYWLANGKPGGHQKWAFLDSPELHALYERQLASINKCDTILASVSKYE
jgi:2-polyprenyl-3-methyl-5-hydroxy-6-metoxy-1,4-benzoquinol methylase